jgi:two-component system sensor histidine kinase EvgS
VNTLVEDFQRVCLLRQSPGTKIFNERIHTLNPEDAEWLEQKWLLPDGSVFDARHSLVEDFQRVCLLRQSPGTKM